MSFQIETKTRWAWTADGIGQDNEFETQAAAQATIEQLLTDPEFAGHEYRVTQIADAAHTNAIVLASHEMEYRTIKVIRIEDDFFLLDENGGSCGAWQNRGNKCEELTRSQARAKLLEMGLEPEEAAKATAK